MTQKRDGSIYCKMLGSLMPQPSWLLTAFLVLFLCMGFFFWGIFADDAYIVARYAHNFNVGYGMVFNAGERVNALTSPLHFAIFVLLGIITNNIVEVYEAIMLVVVALTLLWASKVGFQKKGKRALFLALTMLSPFLTFWTVGGLETPLLLVLLTVVIVRLHQEDGTPANDHGKTLIILCGLIFLTRYDSILFVGPIAAYILYSRRRLLGIQVVSTCMALLIAAWLGFSLYYFGDLLPTSYYTKSPLKQDSTSILKGSLYLLNFLLLSLVFLLFITRRSQASISLQQSIRRAVYVGLSLFLTYGVLAGIKHMMYAYRLFVPYLPVLVFILMRRGGGRKLTQNPNQSAFVISIILAFQFILAAIIYYESQNPNLSLLWKKQDLINAYYEFSTAGARTTKLATNIYRENAHEIKQHWTSQALVRDRPPRVFILPGGLMPYSYPEAYIYETLVSYRHQCQYMLFESADYLQLIYPAINEKYPAQTLKADAYKWEKISSHTFWATGYASPMAINVDVFYQRNPLVNRLPQKINQACL